MGTDDIFKKRKAEREERKHEQRDPKANSFLIVTEGKRTEPLYFQGLKQLITDKIGGQIDVVEKPDIRIEGQGTSTTNLINITDELVKKAKILYQNVWIVFDKDDFTDFDRAIKIGREKGYNIAWSNQCFEYWLYLHFYYSDSALHRDVWESKLNELFRSYNLGDRVYRKNYSDIYNMLNKFGGVDAAISNSKRRMAEFNYKEHMPSEYDPGTTVHILVEQLRKYL